MLSNVLEFSALTEAGEGGQGEVFDFEDRVCEACFVTLADDRRETRDAFEVRDFDFRRLHGDEAAMHEVVDSTFAGIGVSANVGEHGGLEVCGTFV